MKTVLLLGDSIRMSYQSLVTEGLAGRARVVAPAENGAFTLYTFMRLTDWLEELGKPDIVYWNNGIWDLGVCSWRYPHQFSIEDYVGNLGSVLNRLRETGAEIIWRTTTPVQANFPWAGEWTFAADDVVRYNAAALALMRSEGIACHDLGAVVQENLASYLFEDGLHLSPLGQKACADAITSLLLSYI